MIELNVTNLVGGNIVITTSSSGGGGGSEGGSTPEIIPSSRTATRVWYGDDENVYTDYEISGSISGNDYTPTSQIPNVTSAKKIEIGNTVTSIGNYAFSYCHSLTSVTIPDTMTSIGQSAFSYCYSLTSVAIPDHVTSIGSEVFMSCNVLQSATFVGKDRATVQDMSNYPFGLNHANSSGVTIHCTDGDIPVQFEEFC